MEVSLEDVSSTVKADQTTNKTVRGKPKSGRLWKTERKTRYSQFTTDKQLKTSWQKKMKERATQKNIKLFQKELQETRAKRLEASRKRNEENQKRREENRRKAEIVQPIKNTAKLKRMKKKQLRAIEKR